MGARSIAAALAAVALSAPAASAETLTVDPVAGPYTTIMAAIVTSDAGDVIDVHPGFYDEQLFVQQDDLTVRAAQGAMVSSTAAQVVSLMGARDTIEGLYVAGGPGGVRIVGDHATLEDVTVLTEGPGVWIEKGLGATLRRTFVRSTGLQGTALRARNVAATDQAVTLDNAVLVGGRQGTAMDVGTGEIGTFTPIGGLNLVLRHTTVAGAPTALRTERIGTGGPIDAVADSSIVHGDAPGLRGLRSDTTTSDAATFRNAAALDFRLRADAPGIDQGGFLASGDSDRDISGAPRVRAAASDWGAYEFVDTAPTATLTAGTAAVKQGVPLTLDASASADPDPGGRIVSYVWVFGDGSLEARTTTPTVQHVFDTVGRPFVTVRTIDQQGAGATSDKVAVDVIDGIAPALRIVAPREQARLRRLKTVKVKVKVKADKNGKGTRRKTKTIKKRVPNVLRFSGRVDDAGGLAGVTLTFRRVTAARGPVAAPTCSFLDADARRLVSRPCGRPPVLRATVAGGAWSWGTPSRAAMAPGSWELTVTATDRTGNASSGVLHFTVT